MGFEEILAKLDVNAGAKGRGKTRRQKAVRRAGGRRRPGRRGGRDLCGAKRHRHRRRRGTVRRAGARHHVHREFHLRPAHRRTKTGGGAGAARQSLRSRRDEPAKGVKTDPRRRRRFCRRATGERRDAVGENRDPLDRRALALDERARRAGLPQQGRGLLPALRRSAVQGQARGGDRRRQFRRRGGHRPRRHCRRMSP